MENRFCKASRLKEGKTEYHGVSCYAEYGTVQVCGDYHFIHKHGVNADTHHDKKALYAQCEQAFQVIVANASPFPVSHGGKGDRGNGAGQIYLYHSAVEDNRNQHGHNLHAHTN